MRYQINRMAIAEAITNVEIIVTNMELHVGPIDEYKNDVAETGFQKKRCA